MLDILKYRIKKPYHFIKTGLLNGVPAAIRTHHPQKKLFIIMVTGTDGKTTTASLLHHVLTVSGIKTGLISTIAAKIGKAEIDTGLHVTAPQPSELYQLLKRMVDEGCTHLVLEMTSHGAYQYRNWGITPQIGVITNITNEHLDYHVTYAEYVKAKASLFTHTPKVIYHKYDVSSELLSKLLRPEQLVNATKVRLLPPLLKAEIQTRFPQPYNQQNAALVWTVSQELSLSTADIIKAVASFPQLPGRMQVVPTKKPFQVIVDFAHTPAGVKAVLKSVRKQLRLDGGTGKIITVIGCAGLRDTVKRPVIGEISTTLSDIAIFTAEDPRTEDVWSIIRQMSESLTSHHDSLLSIADRGEAIYFALEKCAKKGDIVLILGKGHEKSLCIGHQEYPWNDAEAVKWIVKTHTIPRLGEW